MIRITNPRKVVAQNSNKMQTMPICLNQVVAQMIITVWHVEESHAMHTDPRLLIPWENLEPEMFQYINVLRRMAGVVNKALLLMHAKPV